MKKSIVYWSPCLTKVGTMKSTLNSSISLAKYSKNCEVIILNVFGEWTKFEGYLKKNDVILKNLTFDYYDLLPKKGFLKSRLSYILIFLISAIPLFFFIKKNKPDYFIIHLITSLPLLLLNFFKIKTKFILRISGYPKLNFLRKKLWLISQNKISKITCPTNQLRDDLVKNKVFKEEKITILLDAIINIREFIEKKIEIQNRKPKIIFSDFFLAAGRFTRQKNFIYLIREFSKFVKSNPNENLLIIGEGELKKKMQEEIDKLHLSNNIKILEYTDNIYYFMKNSKGFILSSIWEEVGFVIVEAAFCNSLVISSNCKNGPDEFLQNGEAGLIFCSDVKNKLCEKLLEYKKLNKNQISKKKLLAKKNCSKFTMFNHFLKLNYIINENY